MKSSSGKRRKKKRAAYDWKRMIPAGIVCAFAVFGFICAVVLIYQAVDARLHAPLVVTKEPDFSVELLTVNEFSRPGIERETVNNIVVHYTANPGTAAEQNRGYFEGLKDSGETHASSHFIIGLEGEIIQIIPTNEICYGANDRNGDTLSIEVCHPDETGEFTKESYDKLVELCAWLCGKFSLTPEDIIRHYDVNGKDCPKYYVEHEDAWEQFISDVETYINENGERITQDQPQD